MKNKNILITGGLGFIGSHNADELMEDNHITIIDNLSTGNNKNLKNPEHENLKIVKEDLRNSNLKELTTDIDYIFHLAAMASVPLSVENPIECIDVNVNATVELLKAAADNGVEKIPIAIIGVGYNALTSKEYLYGLPGNSGSLKINAITTEAIIATI